tara:strand:- start:1089 stop:1613 length:525 start_codon:yes stop_codon:yes gene_type:complete
VRIISGKHKGKRIIAPQNLPVRPTTDRAKEALFNILESRYYFNGKNVLDLFSGTGNISYEFASRGIEEIICIDSNYNCIRFIDSYSEQLKINISTTKSDCIEYLNRCEKQFNFIFADPPYYYNNHLELVKIVRTNNLVKDDGCLIIEHDNTTSFEEENAELRKYGTVHFSIFSF